ncbi:hypothetical protein N7504_010883 [Penicillium tannophilum]|nr:hypothetical protein N7504_010883 [Penicillium tannophilum]
MKSFYWALIALSLFLGQAAGYLVSPAGTAAPGSNEDCSLWYRYVNGSDCEAVEVLYEITATEFEEWNPIVTETGSGYQMLADLYYCVEVNFVAGTYMPSSYLTASSASVPAGVYTYIPSTTATSITELSPTSDLSPTASHTALSSSTATSIGSTTTPLPIQTGMFGSGNHFTAQTQAAGWTINAAPSTDFNDKLATHVGSALLGNLGLTIANDLVRDWQWIPDPEDEVCGVASFLPM